VGTRECGHISAMASPNEGEAGQTGEWRIERPVVDESKCIAAKAGKPVCMQCWLYCPEGVIAKEAPIKIDLRYCKGCGICVEVCRTDAIRMVPETAPEDTE